MIDELNLTAIHESGHYIALLKYFGDDEGFRPVKISIIPNHSENYLGIIETSNAALIKEPSFEEFELFIKFWLAGYAAEYIHEGRDDISGYLENLMGNDYFVDGSDFQKTLNGILYHKKSTSGKLSDLLLPYFEKVLIDLKANWHCIQLVSDVLMEKQEIEGSDLRKMTKQVFPQLK